MVLHRSTVQPPLLADVFVIVRCLVCEVLIVSLILSFIFLKTSGFAPGLLWSALPWTVTIPTCRWSHASQGNWRPLWECLGDPCPAPSLIQYAAPVTLQGGATDTARRHLYPQLRWGVWINGDLEGCSWKVKGWTILGTVNEQRIRWLWHVAADALVILPIGWCSKGARNSTLLYPPL